MWYNLNHIKDRGFIMFKETYYIVGASIPTVTPGWIVTTNATKRTDIPAREILDSLKNTDQKYTNFGAAKEAAEERAAKALFLDQSDCAFMEYESPIFEMVGSKIIHVDFQRKTFLGALLEKQAEAEAENNSSCTIS